MAGQTPATSSQRSIQLWPPAVDFIENRMWHYHPAYNPNNFHYSPAQGQFVAGGHAPMRPDLPSLATLAPPQPRPVPRVVNDMDFWEKIFQRAMVELKKLPAPKQANEPQWGIRRCPTWPDAQAKLEITRKDYDHCYGKQYVSRFRRGLCMALEKSAVPLQRIVKGVPAVKITSPIVGVANVLSDVSMRNSKRTDLSDTNAGISSSI